MYIYICTFNCPIEFYQLPYNCPILLWPRAPGGVRLLGWRQAMAQAAPSLCLNCHAAFGPDNLWRMPHWSRWKVSIHECYIDEDIDICLYLDKDKIWI